ncbi:MAG: endolytic transglycosylase MltG [Bacteroidia bacterium]|nr:endolytic transglycosylase MltG [Bacteroidia bacterium]MDW8347604.1 endolytic transglycosylase MltG [Bacteroidia bacterium]
MDQELSSNRQTPRKKKRTLLIITSILSLVLLIAGWLSIAAFSKSAQKDFIVYVKQGTTVQDIIQQLQSNEIISNTFHFKITAQLMGLTTPKIGAYKIEKGFSNAKIVHIFRKGRQMPINVVFRTVRTLEDFSEFVAEKFYVHSDSMLATLKNNQFLKEFGVKDTTVMSILIPDTYQMYWTAKPKEIIQKLYQGYQKFWNAERIQKANDIGLTPLQVTILASIVEAETQRNEEKPIIAGVYLNRYFKKMKLQADPTVVFSAQDFTIKRVTGDILKIDSPYNTYLYEGLPPGPINNPSKTSIDAVLNYQKHNYLFFCAKSDFSGYHVFAQDYETHKKNAKLYQKALNLKGIE